MDGGVVGSVGAPHPAATALRPLLSAATVENTERGSGIVAALVDASAAAAAAVLVTDSRNIEIRAHAGTGGRATFAPEHAARLRQVAHRLATEASGSRPLRPADVEALAGIVGAAPGMVVAAPLGSSVHAMGLLVVADPESHAATVQCDVAAALLTLELRSERLVDALRRDVGVARSANDAKSELLSRMSHELRTPLAAVVGFADLLSLEPLPPQPAQFAASITRGADHLVRLVDEVLEISRIETGTVAISVEPVSLGEVLEGAVADSADALRARGVELAIPAGAAAIYVLADAGRLRDVVQSMLRASLSRGGDGELRLEIHAGDVNSVRVAVVETRGPGDAAEVPALLPLDTDALHARHATLEGAGLGLALTRVLAEAMRGQLDVVMLPEGGSLVWLQLDRAAAPHDDGGGSIIPVQGARRVLYAEDTVSNIRLLQQVLARRPGVTLVPAMLGDLALRLAREDPQPDAIVLDVHLPDMTGEEVLRRLRVDERTRDIPVVLLTADSDIDRRARMAQLGARALLRKPLHVGEFLAVIDELFGISAPG